MKKHYVKWIFQGFAFGLALNTLADFLFSYSLQLGYYAPCLVSLPERLGGELNAALFQACLCGIVGAAVLCLWKKFAHSFRVCYTNTKFPQANRRFRKWIHCFCRPLKE